MASVLPTLFLFQHPPQGLRSARDGIEAVLAFAAFEQPLSVLFVGDGVWQLLPNQADMGKGAKSHSKLLSALAMYEVDQVFVCADSLVHRGLDGSSLCIPCTTLSTEEITALIRQHQPVMSF